MSHLHQWPKAVSKYNETNMGKWRRVYQGRVTEVSVNSYVVTVNGILQLFLPNSPLDFTFTSGVHLANVTGQASVGANS